MVSQLSLPARLVKILLPTRGQAFMCLLIAILITIGVNIAGIMKLFGINDSAFNVALTQYHDRFSNVLTSQLASSTALITFWASVGLVAYLVCWSAYNVMIEARNEVTLETQYTNRGHWRGPFETLGVKAVGSLGLIGSVVILKAGINYWLSLIAPVFADYSVSAIIFAVAGLLGLALQLYLVLAMIIVTFTPWYRKEVFTEQL